MTAFARIRAALCPLVVAVALLAASSPLAAQSARVLGRVTDGAGNSVSGVRVTVQAPDGTQRATTTGQGGGFEFAGLPAGTYTLRAEGAPRVGTREQRITLSAGAVASPVVRLLRGSPERSAGHGERPREQ